MQFRAVITILTLLTLNSSCLGGSKSLGTCGGDCPGLPPDFEIPLLFTPIPAAATITLSTGDASEGGDIVVGDHAPAVSAASCSSEQECSAIKIHIFVLGPVAITVNPNGYHPMSQTVTTNDGTANPAALTFALTPMEHDSELNP